MSEIQLYHAVAEEDFDLLKYGFSHYRWIRSRRRNVHYLMYSRRSAIRRLFVLVVFCVLFAVAIVSACISACDEPSILLLPVILSLAASVIAIRLFLRSSRRVIDRLPTGFIAALEPDRGTVTVRNPSALPFVQIPERRRSMPADDIRKFEYRSAYRIVVNGAAHWNLFGYFPTWHGWYAVSGPEDRPSEQLLFVGMSMPMLRCSFLAETMRKELVLSNDFSRFER